MHISSSFNVPQFVVDKLEKQTFKLQQGQAYKTSLSDVRLLITHLQIFNFCLLMMATQSLVSFSSQISTSILLGGNLPQFLHFKIANNIYFICKQNTAMGISSQNLVFPRTKLR